MSPYVRPYSDHDGSATAINEPASVSASRKSARRILNGVIAALVLSVGILSYSIFAGRFNEQDFPHAQVSAPFVKPIQIDVMNGCGIPAAASRTATYLRKHGFDVVEVRNYRSFAVGSTLVIDRVGNLRQARRVATALGVDESNIVQEINYDYYVEVSVVVGKDFALSHILQP